MNTSKAKRTIRFCGFTFQQRCPIGIGLTLRKVWESNPHAHCVDAGLTNLWHNISYFIADKKEPVSKPEKTEAERGIEKVWFEWQAPERTFQRRNRDFWITAISILVLVGVILIFIKEFYLIVALMSALFLYYGLSTVPPSTVTNKITNKAVYFGDLRYEWVLLRRFWFKTSVGH